MEICARTTPLAAPEIAGTSMEGKPAIPRPSAAVTLLREEEDPSSRSAATHCGAEGGGILVFMVRRHGQSAFAPDVFVFPGGSVHEADRALEREPGLCAPAGEGPTALGQGFRVAAIRECFEEAGVLLARPRAGAPAGEELAPGRLAADRAALHEGTLGLAEIVAREGLILATDALLHWSHWITPEAWPRRFDTHFFLAPMPAGQETDHDRRETTAGLWVRPEEALAAHATGEFPLVYATIRQLQELQGLGGVEATLARFAGRPVRTMRPTMVERDGEQVVLLPEEPGEGPA